MHSPFIPPLLATSWTSAGNAHPQSADERSPLPLSRRAKALSAAGWRGIGLVHADLKEYLQTKRLEDVSRLFDDYGLQFREVEFLTDWWLEGDNRHDSDRVRQDLFEAAATIGAANLKVAPPTGEHSISRERLVNSLGELAEAARSIGIRVALEPLPFSRDIPSAEVAIELLKQVAHPSAGLCLDIWHVARGGSDYEHLVEILPKNMLFVVELDDAAATVEGTLWEDTVHHRLLPGEGELNVPKFIEAVHRIGFDGAWGVEIISETYRKQPVEEAVAAAIEATKNCFLALD